MVNTTRIETSSEGAWQGDNPFNFAFPLLILQTILVLFISRFLAFLLKPLRQPKVIAEILVSCFFFFFWIQSGPGQYRSQHAMYNCLRGLLILIHIAHLYLFLALGGFQELCILLILIQYVYSFPYYFFSLSFLLRDFIHKEKIKFINN